MRKPFPVLHPPEGCTAHVKWNSLDDLWAQKMHGQDLAWLASRGGLNIHEIARNISHTDLYHTKLTDDAAVALVNFIAFK